MKRKDKVDWEFSRKTEWAIAGALAVLAALVFLPGLAGYVFPGESAVLTCQWLGLDVSSANAYPLMATFAKVFGVGNHLAPICAIIAVVTLYHLASTYIRSCVGGEHTAADASMFGRIAGAAAAVSFIFASATIYAATHLEPRLFDAAWALVALSVALPFAVLPPAVAWLAPVAMGAMSGAGVGDSISFVMLAPIYVATVWGVSKRRGGNGYGSATLFVVAFTAAAVAMLVWGVGDFKEYVTAQKSAVGLYNIRRAWYCLPLFASVPFFVSLFSCRRAFQSEHTFMNWTFHILLTLVAVIATATPLSPSVVMSPSRVPPMFSCLFVAFTTGYLVSYWWSLTREVRVMNESLEKDVAAAVGGKMHVIGWCAGGVLLFIVAFTSLVNRFMRFDPDKGAFADAVAARIVEDLGDRTWFVSDGSLDEHLLIAAHRAGRPLNIVNLLRERDSAYIEKLTEKVLAERLCGDHCEELAETLGKYRGLDRKRIIPFLQKWFASDPGVASKVAVFGAPDLWLYANLDPVAELLFFGGDPNRAGEWKDWEKFDEILKAPDGWGSHGLYEYNRDASDYLDTVRLNLRRHMGLIATDCGYSSQERGRKLQGDGKADEATKLYDAAFEMYELVLNKIDKDNVAALFNELELARAGHRKAGSKIKDITAKLNKIKEDESRRYPIGELGILYGYICNPEIILKHGFSLLMRGGRPGDAVNHIRRAIEFVPEKDRAAAELSLLASIYAGGSQADRGKAREMYDNALVRDPTNRQALLGLARLAMFDGETDKAVEYLQKAIAGAGDDPSILTQAALLHLMKNECAKAREVLQKVTDANISSMEAWSLTAAVVMRQIDEIGDTGGDPEKKARKELLEAELENNILPTMEKQAPSPNDHRLLTTRALVLMRKGGKDNIKSARDTLITVAQLRPEMAVTSDMILNLDISMNDTEDAERQATERLLADASNPIANYVMGSLSLKKDDLAAAEKHLRVAVAAKNPSPLALNDYAELRRRQRRFDEAEAAARKAVKAAPGMYIVWDTLGSILLDAGKAFDEAEQCVEKAVELSKDADGRPADVRMLITLARVQIRRGKLVSAKGTLRSVLGRIDELSDYERHEFEELRKSAR
jgi:tetratricopeptide (TPR) repeat protein